MAKRRRRRPLGPRPPGVLSGVPPVEWSPLPLPGAPSQVGQPAPAPIAQVPAVPAAPSAVAPISNLAQWNPIETPTYAKDIIRRSGLQQRDGIITYQDLEGNIIGPPGQPGDPVTVGGAISQGAVSAQPAQAGAIAPAQVAPPVQESLWGTDFDQYQQQWFDKIMAPAQNVLAARGMGAAGGSEFQHATARAGAESALMAWQARMEERRAALEERRAALSERAQASGEKLSWAQLNLQREQLRQSYRMFIRELDYNSYWKYVSGMVGLGSTLPPDVSGWGSPSDAAGGG